MEHELESAGMAAAALLAVADQPSSEPPGQLEGLRLKSLLSISQKAAELSEREIIEHTEKETG